jgi:kynureninase
LSGHGVIRLRDAHTGSIWTTRDGIKPNKSVVKLTGNSLGSFGDRQPENQVVRSTLAECALKGRDRRPA